VSEFGVRGAANRWTAVAVVVAIATTETPAASQVTRLHEVFGEGMVLQRDRPLPLFGRSGPFDSVEVRFRGHVARARADGAGAWRVTLPPLAPGGPDTLSLIGPTGEGQRIADVLVGDVWLCSGQSNMEWPVSATLNGAAEVSRARNPRIRLLTIPRDASPVPRGAPATRVAWQSVTPESVRGFSAACYYFAQELQPRVDVPMGLIHASWGGSSIQAWIGSPTLREVGGYDGALDLLDLMARDPDAARRRYAEGWERWWVDKGGEAVRPWRTEAMNGGWRAVPEPLRDWKSWGVRETASHNGLVWFRSMVHLTSVQASQAVQLDLGGIDEIDLTWVNGVPVGEMFGWGTERSYPVPAGLLRAGENVITVGVVSTWDAGGLLGPASRMALRLRDGGAVPLVGAWQYLVPRPGVGTPPRAPWESIGGLSTLFNGMIAPLGPLALRGALWYQGESNTGAAAQYAPLLRALFADWRRQFGAPLPFLVVQLPNFGQPNRDPVASGWAEVRDAQRRAVAADSLSALVVTIDVGDRFELHPPNKQEIGRRLARAARAKVYGEALSPSGALPRMASRTGDAIVVEFGDVEGALAALSSRLASGFEVCGETQASCRFVEAQLRDRSVRLGARAPEERSAATPAVRVTRVRYCWGDAPVCNLTDASGLPVTPFELAVRPAAR